MLIVGDKSRISTTVLFYGPVIVTVDREEHVSQPYIQSIVNELTGRGKSQANLESTSNVIKVIDEILKEYKKDIN